MYTKLPLQPLRPLPVPGALAKLIDKGKDMTPPILFEFLVTQQNCKSQPNSKFVKN